jgi:methylmalonyl-CoA mutase
MKDFEPSSAAVWKQKIQFELNGADYIKTLLTNTNEGITIKPFYHLDTFEKLTIPIIEEDFKICQKIKISSETSTNLYAIDLINRGANSLKFIIDKPFEIELLFENLLNKNIEFHFQFLFLSEDFISKLIDFLINETVFYNIDIIGNLAKSGNWHTTMQNDFKIIETLLQKDTSHFILSVNTDIYENAGANTVQQIAYALAHASEYLTKFGGKIGTKIQFNLAIGTHYFFEISKIRALRYLYPLILSKYNCKTTATIYAEPSLRNKTLYDFNINMLRTTTESMSAILGGVNTISNCSYDSLFNKPNEFGDRISRNQLLLLKEESNFKNAQNATTNAYYIESITKQIAEKALNIFKEIEKSGGFLHQLKEGTIQRKIKENAQKEQAQFDAKKLVLVGTNKYTNELDKMKHRLEVNPFIEKKSYKTLIIPIIPKRLSEKLEQKRLKKES